MYPSVVARVKFEANPATAKFRVWAYGNEYGGIGFPTNRCIRTELDTPVESEVI